MANFFYAHAVTEHVLGNLSWSASMVARAVGVNEDIGRHTPDQMAHAFLSDIDVADQVAISPPLENKEALLDGVFAADPSFFEAVPAGDGVVISAVVIYYEIGDPTTSPMLIHITDMAGLPAIPNGTNIDLAWNPGPDRIGRI
jgi:hypothetical protein